jgi:dTDP-4-amino-4,6-dideoxygalactose transaminase
MITDLIPVASPHSRYLAHKEKIDQAVLGVLAKGSYILGTEVAQFEQEFAAWCGTRFAIGVANGTDAIILALKALGIGTGDEVITASHTAVATVAAIELAGATPRLVDIDPNSRCISPEAVEAAISPRTRAILPVHLYGHPADMDGILSIAKDAGLPVIEDCAQAHGATWRGRRVGTMGVLGTFSFYPTKNLGTFGDGGAITTDDPALYQRLLELRQYGWRERYISAIPGMNSRLDEIHAAVLRVLLPSLDAENAARQRIAGLFTAALSGSTVTPPSTHDNATHVYHLYVVSAPVRDAFRSYLESHGIHSGIHYPAAVHQQPAYQRLTEPGSLPHTESLYRHHVTLPLYPELSPMAVEHICTTLKAMHQFYA